MSAYNALPDNLGVGFKPKHLQEIQEDTTPPTWLEVHPENYMGDGGLPHRQLELLRQDFPISMHGVGMSLGSASGIDNKHLQRLAELVDRYQPAVISEHLAWSHWNSIFFNDLLPLPYIEETLLVLERNIQQVQEAIGRTILIENPSLYVGFGHNEMTEPQLLNELGRRTGCGLLCDVNNIYVSCANLDLDAEEYLAELDLNRIGEIHLAGHSLETSKDGSELRIDDHGSTVIDEVWNLYRSLLDRSKRPIATLVEWDTDVPEYQTLMQEAQKAKSLLAELFPEVCAA